MTRLLRSTPRVTLALSLALGLALPITASAAGGGGGGGGSMGGMSSSSSGPSRPKTPTEIARSRYERGLKYRDRALGYEAKAAVSDKGWLFGSKPSVKAEAQWRKAIEAYEQAIESKSDLYEAHSDLGFALRKLGEYERSLAAYDRALEIRSDYAPAIEYRGEAYLNLLRIDDAKQAYMRLFVLDRDLAGQLMEHMQSWLERTGSGPVEGLSTQEIDTFRAWVNERAELAGQAGGAVSDTRGW